MQEDLETGQRTRVEEPWPRESTTSFLSDPEAIGSRRSHGTSEQNAAAQTDAQTQIQSLAVLHREQVVLKRFVCSSWENIGGAESSSSCNREPHSPKFPLDKSLKRTKQKGDGLL